VVAASDGDGADRAGDHGPERDREPLKSYERILTEEIRLADAEMDRPASAIAVSGLLAGLGVGISVLLVAVFGTVTPEGTSELVHRILLGNAYAAGFLLVIFARADLFTEYTTIALLPVMLGHSTVRSLARLWGIVWAANIVGATVAGAAVAGLSAIHGPVELAPLTDAALELVRPEFGAIVASAVVAGWLMGLLSWLIIAARETISQVVFVWAIGMIIGLAHLHHSITGTAEAVAGMVASPLIGVSDVLHLLAASTLGNALGAVLFATLIRYSVAHPSKHASSD
jgi:formate-nitrite transporter family protein